MKVSLEELNQIEKRFRNYIFVLDFLLRETRTELTENRAKRETWLEGHENWKKKRYLTNREDLSRLEKVIKKEGYNREFRPLQNTFDSKSGGSMRTASELCFRPQPLS
ncbi:hypothetical protein EHQ97_13145 [Leptospira adleri]|nr:hypothetical protein EHQ97_13145 [Leptospira adleri]